MKIAMAVEYDGHRYHGWQYQPGLDTVQGHVAEAVSRIADETVTIHCAGRTDTGVHATYQVIHFETDAKRSPRAWVFGGNSHLPNDISLLWAKPVDEDFHARFSAESRRYRYVIHNSRVNTAIMRNHVTWYQRQLNVRDMQQAAKVLVGKHDFSAYRAAECQAHSPERTVHALKVYRRHQWVIIDIHANAFLHHMVRNIAGVLMAIGSGRRSVNWAQEVLESRDRSQGGMTAAPYGLYFIDVAYPSRFKLPSSDLGPFNI